MTDTEQMLRRQVDATAGFVVRLHAAASGDENAVERLQDDGELSIGGDEETAVQEALDAPLSVEQRAPWHPPTEAPAAAVDDLEYRIIMAKGDGGPRVEFTITPGPDPDVFLSGNWWAARVRYLLTGDQRAAVLWLRDLHVC